MNKIFHKEYWKKAGGEILSFVVVVPCLFALVLAMLGVAQIGIADQTLNFCAYNCCRAAIVSTDLDVAKERAIEIYAEQYDIDPAVVEANGNVSIEFVEGTEWEKGALVKCTITRDVDTMLPFTSGPRSQSIVMMVENGGVI